jgi:hypothetical protein
MLKSRWLLGIPLAVVALSASAPAATVRDQAGLFGADAVRQAQETLDRIEQELNVPIVIETVETLQGATIEDESLRRARASRSKGVYVLIARKETDLEVRDYQSFLGADRRRAITDAFRQGFRQGDFDAGLARGVKAIGSQVAETGGRPRTAPARQGRPVVAPPPRGVGQAGGSGIGTLLVIGLGIVGVLLVLRLLGSLFRGASGYGGPARVGGPGGYGGGYGGGGGGFFSSLFGGIGGAMAGNWLYDQFSGRQHHDGGSYGASEANAADPGGPAAEAGDWGGTSADWGGGDASGGDWGGGGGGDWGGGDGGGGDGGGW